MSYRWRSGGIPPARTNSFVARRHDIALARPIADAVLEVGAVFDPRTVLRSMWVTLSLMPTALSLSLSALATIFGFETMPLQGAVSQRILHSAPTLPSTR